MKAFAILDGGGVKGAALAGALAAAEDKRIKFEGYGGTSAGSIVALLASIGYSGLEICDLLKSDVHPLQMLDDDGTRFRSAREAVREGMTLIREGSIGCCGRKAYRFFQKHRTLLQSLGSDLGLYPGQKFAEVLQQLIVRKYPQLKDIDDPTFQDLRNCGGSQLKIVASDTHARRAVVYHGGDSSPSQSVIAAVRASACYPFFFTPIQTNSGKRLVDGGLSSNLPTFLFSEEHDKTQLPIIAFDLVSGVRPPKAGVFPFIEELADTAFEASDDLIGTLLPGLKHVPIRVPPSVHTLQFDLTESDIDAMFSAGRSDASSCLDQWEVLANSTKAGEEIQKQLKVYYGPEALFDPVLRGLKMEMETTTAARNVRTYIMVPTGRSDGSRIIVYHHGFAATDTDRTLELAEFGGCSGKANESHAPTFADLEEAKRDFAKWTMTQDQQNLVKDDRQAMLSVPVFARESRTGEAPQDVPVRAILSIDTDTPLRETGWLKNGENDTPSVTQGVTEVAIEWAAVVSKLLS